MKRYKMYLIYHQKTLLQPDDKLTKIIITLAHQLLSGLERGVYVLARCYTSLNHVSSSHACIPTCIILACKPAYSIMCTHSALKNDKPLLCFTA